MVDYKDYARIVLKKGLALKKGQNLLISCNEGNYAMARTLAVEAYALGAGYVEISVGDNYVTRARLAAQEGEALDYVPHYAISRGHQMLSEDWARIRIDSTEELDVLKDADPGRLARHSRAGRKALEFVSRSMMKGEHAWCVICVPGPRWAQKVLGDGASTEDLWEVLKPILRLDQDDPEKAWEDHREALEKRCKALDAMKLDRLHFKSKETDLHIGLTPYSRWEGGGSTLPDGRSVFFNLPTEEVFTTPDWRRCEGLVKVTKELKVLETMVRGAWFRFEKGRVAEFGASEGESVLAQFLEIDEGAPFPGEIALVDEASPIAQSKLLFGSILYDENASCHMALGAGYPSCLELPSGADESEEGLKAAGCNRSLVHTDFMIGSSAMDVTGYNKEGKAFPIIRKGGFII